MVKLSGKEHDLSASVKKMGVIFLLIAGALTFCACDGNMQQVQTLSAESESATEANVASKNKVVFKTKTVAKTVDVMKSPSISIQINEDTLTVSNEGKNASEAEAESDNLQESESVSQKSADAKKKAAKPKTSAKKSPKEPLNVQQNTASLPNTAVTYPTAVGGIDYAVPGAVDSYGLASNLPGIPSASTPMPAGAPAAVTNPTINNSDSPEVYYTEVSYSVGDEGNNGGGSNNSGDSDSGGSDSGSSDSGSDIICNFE